jgi:hypothetical protein
MSGRTVQVLGKDIQRSRNGEFGWNWQDRNLKEKLLSGQLHMNCSYLWILLHSALANEEKEEGLRSCLLRTTDC